MSWLRRIVSLTEAALFGNFGLKLLSIGLAIGLWFFVNAAQRDSEEKFSVGIRLERTPGDLMLVSPRVEEVELKVSGPRTLLSRIEKEGLAIDIDLSGVRAGVTTFRLRADRLGLPRGVTPVRMTPSELTLEFAKVESKQVPVNLAVDGRPPGDLRIIESKVSPEKVDVKGPARIVREIAVVTTMPFDISDAEPGRLTREVGLAIDAELLTVSSPTVNVEMLLEEPAIEGTTEDMEIIVRNPGGTATVEPATMAVQVRGPRSKIEGLELPAGAIYVDAAGLAPGTHRLQPAVVLPVDVELARELAKVKVAIQATATVTATRTVASPTPSAPAAAQVESNVSREILWSTEVGDEG